jgi:N-acyl-D-amino-acid deacylase
MAADLVLFDDAVTDRATFSDSTALPSGIAHVWVNGRAVVAEGRQTGARPGRLL